LTEVSLLNAADKSRHYHYSSCMNNRKIVAVGDNGGICAMFHATSRAMYRQHSLQQPQHESTYIVWRQTGNSCGSNSVLSLIFMQLLGVTDNEAHLRSRVQRPETGGWAPRLWESSTTSYMRRVRLQLSVLILTGFYCFTGKVLCYLRALTINILNETFQQTGVLILI